MQQWIESVAAEELFVRLQSQYESRPILAITGLALLGPPTRQGSEPLQVP